MSIGRYCPRRRPETIRIIYIVNDVGGRDATHSHERRRQQSHNVSAHWNSPRREILEAAQSMPPPRANIYIIEYKE